MAIELERKLGFTATSCPGDPTLVVVRRDLAPLLDRGLTPQREERQYPGVPLAVGGKLG